MNYLFCLFDVKYVASLAQNKLGWTKFYDYLGFFIFEYVV